MRFVFNGFSANVVRDQITPSEIPPSHISSMSSRRLRWKKAHNSTYFTSPVMEGTRTAMSSTYKHPATYSPQPPAGQDRKASRGTASFRVPVRMDGTQAGRLGCAEGHGLCRWSWLGTGCEAAELSRPHTVREGNAVLGRVRTSSHHPRHLPGFLTPLRPWAAGQGSCPKGSVG